MRQIDISEAKAQLPALLDAAINGAEIIITRDDRPLVRLVHIDADQKHNGVSGDITAPAPSDLTNIEIEVMATVGGFLNDHLPDRFCAGRPQFDQDGFVWKTLILLSYPTLGPLGQVGEITVSADASAILSFTPLEEMRSAAQALIEQHREEIEAPLL
ncbi:MAG: type II toxin-antitoxin system Phd/YefM family antitoxin [Acidobacteria bacterium]|nr:type II toxin-antitoxin system Phd/YefM family antitoxin [Acidobacteriota bacterium]